MILKYCFAYKSMKRAFRNEFSKESNPKTELLIGLRGVYRTILLYVRRSNTSIVTFRVHHFTAFHDFFNDHFSVFHDYLSGTN